MGISIQKKTDLFTNNSALTNTAGGGWETNVAKAPGDKGVILYTGNYFAAYSTDGASFTAIDVGGICAAYGETFCCDQHVIYVPKIDQFVWIIQTAAGNYILATASPEEILNYNGKVWTSWLIASSNFYQGGQQVMDYPKLAHGDNFLYITFNLWSQGFSGPNGSAYGIVLRIPLQQLQAQANTLTFSYYALDQLNDTNPSLPTQNWYAEPAQNVGDTGYFASLNSTSDLRVFAWPENSQLTWFDVPLQTIADQDWPIPTPSGQLWLNQPANPVKYNLATYGATVSPPVPGSPPNQLLWVAWNAARQVSGGNSSGNNFNYPHIGIGVIDLTNRTLNQFDIFNNDYAFAWPVLATNPVTGDVAMAFYHGGNQVDPVFDVALLNNIFANANIPTSDIAVVSSTPNTLGGGGHFTGIQPHGNGFCAAGWMQEVKSGGTQQNPNLENHPWYVRFS